MSESYEAVVKGKLKLKGRSLPSAPSVRKKKCVAVLRCGVFASVCTAVALGLCASPVCVLSRRQFSRTRTHQRG